jgi:hypothetical protein
MAKVKKRVLALSQWTNQLWRVITCWCISEVTWSHDLNSYMVIWYKSQGLICVCFKRWYKDVCDPYEATPWRNHTWETNYSRSLLNYILFNLSIGIIVLSRGIQKEGWCLPKLKPLYSKAIFWKAKISLTFYGWSWLGLRNLECSCWKADELLQLQLSFSAELNFSWVELSQLQLNFNFSCEPLWPYTSWTCLRAVELGFSLLNSLVKTTWTGPKGQFNWSLTPLTSDQQSASQTGKQVARGVRGGSTALGRFNRSGQPWSACRLVCQSVW